MNKFLAEFREKLAWQGMLGIALLVLVWLFMTLALSPLEKEVAFMRSHLDTANSKAAMQRRTFSLGDRQKELGLFFDSLPVEQDVTDILAGIYSVAESSGLSFKQAEYSLNERNKPRVEYAVVFRVEGEYAKILFLVSRVLADHPAISLDQISFQRDSIKNPISKAEISLTLFLKPTAS
ncbi:MAG: type 4a pilus biogenesis protein PilO [Gallionellaceae bacterium]